MPSVKLSFLLETNMSVPLVSFTSIYFVVDLFSVKKKQVTLKENSDFTYQTDEFD